MIVVGVAATAIRWPLLEWLVWVAHPSSRTTGAYEVLKSTDPIGFDGRALAIIRPEAIYVGPRAVRADSNGTFSIRNARPGVHPIQGLFGPDPGIDLRVRFVRDPPLLQVMDRDRAWAEFDVGTGELRAIARRRWLNLMILGTFALVAGIVGRRVLFHRRPFTVVGVLVGTAAWVAGLYGVVYVGR